MTTLPGLFMDGSPNALKSYNFHRPFTSDKSFPDHILGNAFSVTFDIALRFFPKKFFLFGCGMNIAASMKNGDFTLFIEFLAPSIAACATVGSVATLQRAQPLQSLIVYGCGLPIAGMRRLLLQGMLAPWSSKPALRTDLPVFQPVLDLFAATTCENNPTGG